MEAKVLKYTFCSGLLLYHFFFNRVLHFYTNLITISAKAEEYKNLGNNEFSKNKYATAKDLYTEGIKVNCKDQELNAKLYNNRAAAQFYLGKVKTPRSDNTKCLHWNANIFVVSMRRLE